MAPKRNGNKKDFNRDQPKTPVTQDPRFSSVHNDPRFVRPKKRDMKVTIDKRFAGMMNSTDFSDGPRVDKYGRRLEQGTAKKELERFYQIDSEDEDEDKSLEQLEKELAEDEENLRDEEEVKEEGYDPMRGRGVISSSDEDSDDDEAVESEEESEDELDKIKRVEEGDETSRLALVNMDWDKIKAVDILKALSGFKPDTGVIKSVTIYPSEFGKERIALEESQGPPKEIFKSKAIGEKENSDDSDSDEEMTAEKMIKNQLEEGDGQDFDQEALRKYQLDRLKYYYAVVECDSPATAKVVYKTCDNTEYESSANFFDLRYIPEDMTFDDQPKDAATVAPDGYTPTQFKTDALQRTKVSLTWDEDDVNRYQITRREFTQDDLKDLDFDAYLASSDEEEEEENLDALREKYKKLLSGGSKSNAYNDKSDSEDDEGDMEITFTPGLSEAAGALVEEEEDHKEETTIEKYVRKQKEKRQKKKQSTKKAEEKEEEEESDLDDETANDPFFKEAMEEMEEEGFTKTESKKEKKNKKKRASKQEREEKARERAELELLMDDDGKSEGFNMKEVLKREKLEKKKKGKKSKLADMGQDDFEIDVHDPRFAAVQDSHHFAIDPTNPQFKKTKSMQKLITARQHKLKESSETVKDEWKKGNKPTNSNTAATTEGASSTSSLQQLVASVKRKGALDKKSDTGKRQKKN